MNQKMKTTVTRTGGCQAQLPPRRKLPHRCDSPEQQLLWPQSYEGLGWQASSVACTLLMAGPFCVSLQGGVQTETVTFGSWEGHTRGIGSKLMIEMGYVKGAALGQQPGAILEPVQVPSTALLEQPAGNSCACFVGTYAAAECLTCKSRHGQQLATVSAVNMSAGSALQAAGRAGQ